MKPQYRLEPALTEKASAGIGAWPKKERSGFNCTGCQKHHEFGVYVAAHWDEELIHTCECGSQHTVRRGTASPLKPKRRKATK